MMYQQQIIRAKQDLEKWPKSVKIMDSVFEIDVDYGTFLKVKDKLLKIIDPKHDSLRIYYLGNNWKHRVEHYGTKETYDPEGVLIF